MLIWHRGSVAVAHSLEQAPVSVPEFLADLRARGVPRVPGTAVFLTRTLSGVPPVMIWHLKHNRALHECLLALTVVTTSRPRVRPQERIAVVREGDGFWRVTAHYGFIDTLAKYPTPWSFDSGGMSHLSNQFAAMPSVHICWATFCAIALATHVEKLWAKVLAWSYPILTLIVIVITANHYFLDALGGLVILAAGWIIAGKVTRAGRGPRLAPVAR